MASFYGYVTLIIGLSLLLGMAGVQTTSWHFINTFMPINATSPTGNFTADTSKFNFDTPNTLLYVIWGLFIALAGVGAYRAIVGGVSGIAETLKVTAVTGLLGLMVMDFIAIINYLNGHPIMDGAFNLLALLIYVPLTFGVIISALDWIGGGK